MTEPTLFGMDEYIVGVKCPKACPAPPGTGPDGETCRTCRRKMYKEWNGRRYYKCGLITPTRGAGTDIRLKWAACKYWKEPKSEEDH